MGLARWQTTTNELKIDDWTFEDSLIFYKDKCYEPNDLDLWRKILEKYHKRYTYWTPWTITHSGNRTERLLVAWPPHICQELCWWMCHVPATQDQLTPAKPTPATDQKGKYPPVFANHHGLHYQSPYFRRLWFYHGHSGPWIYEGGNSRTLQQDHRRGRNWEDSTWLTLPTIRTTRQSYLRQRPTIRIPRIQRTRTTTRNQAEHEHRTSSSDRWSYGMSQSRDWSLSIYILLQQPWQMAIITPNPQICRQLETRRYPERIPIVLTNGIQSPRNPHRLSQDQCTWHSRAIIATARSTKRSWCCTWTRMTENDGMNHMWIQTVQRRGQVKIPQTLLQKQETSPERRRTIQSPRSSKSPQLPTRTPEILANSSCHPHHPSIPLQRKRYPRNQLRNTTPWPYRRWTQVQS